MGVLEDTLAAPGEMISVDTRFRPSSRLRGEALGWEMGPLAFMCRSEFLGVSSSEQALLNFSLLVLEMPDFSASR